MLQLSPHFCVLLNPVPGGGKCYSLSALNNLSFLLPPCLFPGPRGAGKVPFWTTTSQQLHVPHIQRLCSKRKRTSLAPLTNSLHQTQLSQASKHFSNITSQQFSCMGPASLDTSGFRATAVSTFQQSQTRPVQAGLFISKSVSQPHTAVAFISRFPYHDTAIHSWVS